MAKLLQVPAARIRDFARSGLITPRRGPRNEYRFAFQDLVLMRTARDLLAADVPYARVRRALQNLRQQLPSGKPLSGVRIAANGDQVVVRAGSEAWIPESGQVLLDFEVAALAEDVAPLVHRLAEDTLEVEEVGATGWYELGCDLELTSTGKAREAYRRALEIDPDHVETHQNLGRLLHGIGQVAASERHFRQVLRLQPDNALAHFNLGVALEDMGRLAEAAVAYERSVLREPDNADAHFNLAGVLEQLDRKPSALQHLKTYRRLIEGSPDPD